MFCFIICCCCFRYYCQLLPRYSMEVHGHLLDIALTLRCRRHLISTTPLDLRLILSPRLAPSARPGFLPVSRQMRGKGAPRPRTAICRRPCGRVTHYTPGVFLPRPRHPSDEGRLARDAAPSRRRTASHRIAWPPSCDAAPPPVSNLEEVRVQGHALLRPRALITHTPGDFLCCTARRMADPSLPSPVQSSPVLVSPPAISSPPWFLAESSVRPHGCEGSSRTSSSFHWGATTEPGSFDGGAMLTDWRHFPRTKHNHARRQAPQIPHRVPGETSCDTPCTSTCRRRRQARSTSPHRESASRQSVWQDDRWDFGAYRSAGDDSCLFHAAWACPASSLW
jgi:hypothetical protein